MTTQLRLLHAHVGRYVRLRRPTNSAAAGVGLPVGVRDAWGRTDLDKQHGVALRGVDPTRSAWDRSKRVAGRTWCRLRLRLWGDDVRLGRRWAGPGSSEPLPVLNVSTWSSTRCQSGRPDVLPGSRDDVAPRSRRRHGALAPTWQVEVEITFLTGRHSNNVVRRPDELEGLGPSGVDWSFAVVEARCVAAGAVGDDLADDRDGRLLRGAGADDRRHQPGEVGGIVGADLGEEFPCAWRASCGCSSRRCSRPRSPGHLAPPGRRTWDRG